MKETHICLAMMTIALLACSGGKQKGLSWDDMPVVYLLKVDSASLTPHEWPDYQFYRMMASYSYLLSMEKQRLDSVIHVLKQHYPKGHKHAFRIRQLELVYYCNRLGSWQKADSLADDLKGYMQHKGDSSRWYHYKSHVKIVLSEPDSAMKHYRIATETGNGFIASQAYERMGMIAQARQSGEDAFRMLQKAQRVNERNRMMQENVMLKQREELSALREKEALLRERDARMREELFKRINVFEKLSETEKEKHIQLSDRDWKEIQLMLDSGYDDFIKKLRIRFPMLSEKDINFCCLVKINMSIQSLTDIYCISKNSVSRRKLRLKEKMGIGEEVTLDEFLNEGVSK